MLKFLETQTKRERKFTSSPVKGRQ